MTEADDEGLEATRLPRTSSPPCDVRAFTEGDWPHVWPIIHDIVTEQETFSYDPATTEDEARSLWIVDPPGRCTVALVRGEVVGTANMYANRPGPGGHVASGSFMVATPARGRGVGDALLRDALTWAASVGFDGMQFNAVVEGNSPAENLYERNGFTIIGTVPRSFASPTRGKVGLHVMYRALP